MQQKELEQGSDALGTDGRSGPLRNQYFNELNRNGANEQTEANPGLI